MSYGLAGVAGENTKALGLLNWELDRFEGNSFMVRVITMARHRCYCRRRNEGLLSDIVGTGEDKGRK